MPYGDLCKGRISLVGQIYHLTLCTHQRQPWFDDFCIARSVVRQMRRLQDEQQLDTLAWVLMPDHLHWMVSKRSGLPLSALIRLFKGRTAGVARADCRGRRLWQRGFYDHALRQDEALTGVARYIVANPLRAGLVRQIGQYPHWDAVWL
ncbi:MAG TPA: transposase [Pseudomonas sp.]|jgi:REP element-mobilizing transposase RayT|uniref:REP-associated tyrosine transposase n=1 Tax=Pseudomonas sp. TaxID=306 RepID=UPI002B930515|nr:transposase [Pseudomonas sp.]HTO19353.1 transposase [Pseudomonas sp.]